MALNFKRIAPNFILIISALCAVLLLAEVALRFLQPDILGKSDERNRFCRYDSNLGWAHIPLSRGRLMDKDFNVSVRINSKGLRDKEYPYEKPAGVKRAVVLGDSFAWGYGVEESERFTEILEAKLPNTEMINMGVSGYGTDQEYLYFMKEGVLYQPDLLILMVHPFTDFSDNRFNYSNEYFKPLFMPADGSLALTNVPVSKDTLGVRADKWMAGRSALWHYFGNRAFRGKKLRFYWAQFIDRLFRNEFPRIEKNETRVSEITCSICGELQKDAGKAGVPFRVVLVPDIMRGGKVIRRLREYDALRDCLSRGSIEAIDLTPVFEKQMKERPEERLIFESDLHWNARGHGLAAEAMEAFIRNGHD